MNGGWQNITGASGQSFANQGQCIAYANHHPVTLADLANSSVSGALSPSGGCSDPNIGGFIFGATYPGSSAVGTVGLGVYGCIPSGTPGYPLTMTYSGPFTITTNVGTLTGTDEGQINNTLIPLPPVPLPFPQTVSLTLTVTSGTGLFTGTTGTLDVSVLLPHPGSLAFVASVTTA